METLRIEIVNKKAMKILKELADLKLINIQDKSTMKSFQNLLNRLRSNKDTPSLLEITREVELVRGKRYGKQSIPSPKAEPFKLWLAQVGSDRLDEIENEARPRS